MYMFEMLKNLLDETSKTSQQCLCQGLTRDFGRPGTVKPKTAFSRRVRDACDLGGGGEDLRVIAYFKRAMQWAIRSTNYPAIDSCICKYPSFVIFASFLKRKFLIRFQQGLLHRLSLVPPCMQPGSSPCGTFSS